MSTGRILILDEVRGRLAPRGAILTGDHVVLTPKAKGHFHAPGYFDKDRVLSDPVSLLAICHEIARRFADDGIEAIAAPTIAGVSLAAVIAVEMYRLTGQDCLNWGYAEEVEEAIEVCRVVDGVVSEKRETLLVPTKSRRVIKRCFPDYFKGKRTLVGEDVFSSGGSAKLTIDASREVGADVVGVAVVCNRSGLTAVDFGVPKLEVLFDIPMLMYPEEDCPLCQANVPINMQVGHGAKFFARHPESQVPRKQ